MTTESLRNVKDHLSEFVDRVEKHHERVVVTRNGRPAAVLISPDDLESLEETLAWLSDPELRRRFEEGTADLAGGRIVTGEDLARRYPRR
ncbi:MAG: type II toxin-antitoxin system Phd/YefM family antitoxin [Acidimicrobiia bacterium]